jgi:hypothetical protein
MFYARSPLRDIHIPARFPFNHTFKDIQNYIVRAVTDGVNILFCGHITYVFESKINSTYDLPPVTPELLCEHREIPWTAEHESASFGVV